MPNKSRSYTFYSLHLPILFFVLALTLVASYVMRPDATDVPDYAYALVQEQGEILGTNTSIITEGGKTAEVTKELVGDKIIIRIKVYDDAGNLIREKVTEKDAQPVPQKMEQLQVEEQVRTQEQEQNREQLRETTGNRMLTQFPNTPSRFPISLNEETGAFFIQTPRRIVELGAMPDAILEKVQQGGTMTRVENVTIESDESDEPVYKVHGMKEKALLRVLPVNINVEETYSVESGEKVSSRIPTLKDRIFNYLSF